MSAASELLRTGVIAGYDGIPIYRSYDIERGTTLVFADPGRRGGGVMFQGAGLRRGIPHHVPGLVERGYLTGAMGVVCDLVDAVTGHVVRARSIDATEIT